MHTRLGTAADHQDLYRCFIYEKEKNGKVFHLAQSGDASCAGVLSATEGARTMRLQKGTQLTIPFYIFPSSSSERLISSGVSTFEL
jgi:hypothetical protein